MIAFQTTPDQEGKREHGSDQRQWELNELT